MKRALVLAAGLAAAVAVGVAAFLWMPATLASATAGTGSLGSRNMVLGLFALGLLAFAALGFDIRDWL